MSITVRILRDDGAIINEVDFTSTDQPCIHVDRTGLYRFGPRLEDVAPVSPIGLRVAGLQDRVIALEALIGATQRRDADAKSELRDTGAALVDKARARLTNAEAERVELEVAATRRALSLCDDSPLAGYSVNVDHEAHRPGERVLRISFDDGAGRTAIVALPFALALKLNSSLGRAVAERLDAAGER